MSSEQLLALMIAALIAPDATDAGDQVFRPGDWPTQADQYPRLKIRVPRESKRSTGRGGPPEFTVVTTVRIIGEVSAPAEVGNAGAAAAEAALWQLYHQVERAVIGSYPLELAVQDFPTIDAQLAYNSEAETHLAGIQIDLALEWYQGPESFAPVQADDVADLQLTAVGYPQAGFSVDLSS